MNLLSVKRSPHQRINHEGYTAFGSSSKRFHSYIQVMDASGMDVSERVPSPRKQQATGILKQGEMHEVLQGVRTTYVGEAEDHNRVLMSSPDLARNASQARCRTARDGISRKRTAWKAMSYDCVHQTPEHYTLSTSDLEELRLNGQLQYTPINRPLTGGSKRQPPQLSLSAGSPQSQRKSAQMIEKTAIVKAQQDSLSRLNFPVSSRQDAFHLHDSVTTCSTDAPASQHAASATTSQMPSNIEEIHEDALNQVTVLPVTAINIRLSPTNQPKSTKTSPVNGHVQDIFVRASGTSAARDRNARSFPDHVLSTWDRNSHSFLDQALPNLETPVSPMSLTDHFNEGNFDTLYNLVTPVRMRNSSGQNRPLVRLRQHTIDDQVQIDHLTPLSNRWSDGTSRSARPHTARVKTAPHERNALIEWDNARAVCKTSTGLMNKHTRSGWLGRAPLCAQIYDPPSKFSAKKSPFQESTFDKSPRKPLIHTHGAKSCFLLESLHPSEPQCLDR
jgi:hypothetical protein